MPRENRNVLKIRAKGRKYRENGRGSLTRWQKGR